MSDLSTAGKSDRLKEAYADYWAAQTRAEWRGAYHAILLFGGADGYRFGWRAFIVRQLRRLAAHIEEH